MDTKVHSSLNWVEKLSLETKENEDGSLDLIFEWDKNDPDLKYWTGLTDEQREEFIKNTLENSIKSATKE